MLAAGRSRAGELQVHGGGHARAPEPRGWRRPGSRSASRPMCSAGRLPMPVTAVLRGIGTGGHPVGGTASGWAWPWGWGQTRPTRLLSSFRVGACSCAPTMAFVLSPFFLFFAVLVYTVVASSLSRRRCGAWVLVGDDDGLGGWCVEAHPQPTGFTLRVEVWLARHPRGYPHRETCPATSEAGCAVMCIARLASARGDLFRLSLASPGRRRSAKDRTVLRYISTLRKPIHPSQLERTRTEWLRRARQRTTEHWKQRTARFREAHPACVWGRPRLMQTGRPGVCGSNWDARLSGIVRIRGGKAPLSLMLYFFGATPP